MKLQGKQIEPFLRQAPDAAAVLIYGPDGGLVRERAEILVRLVAEDPQDPFRVSELAGDAVAKDPAALADAVGALALTGGRRAVRLRGASDRLTGVLKDVLGQAAGDAVLLVEAGDLGSRSSLRRLFEGARNAVALPCYADTADSLGALIDATLRQAEVEATPAARAYLAQRLGGDRQLSRRELEKLVLYAGPGGRIDEADAAACVGDTAALTLEDVAFAAADGDSAALDRALQRVWQEGTEPIGVLRAAATHFRRLQLAAARVAAGARANEAIQALRPPVFFKRRDRFVAQLGRWSPARLASAQRLLLEAEYDCKQTGAPGAMLCAVALGRLARAGAVRRG
jgi:DNA polymerase-3 subunit delta